MKIDTFVIHISHSDRYLVGMTKSILQNVLIVALGGLVFFALAPFHQISAATTSFRVFDHTVLDPAPRKTGNAAWSGSVPVTFPFDAKPGTHVFLSGDPAGTSSATIRDILDLSIVKQGVASNNPIVFSYDARGADPVGCADMRPLPKTDITNLFIQPPTIADRTHWVAQAWLRVRCLVKPYEFGPLYIVVTTDDLPSPLPTTSPTPTPPLGSIEPGGFLELPWNYNHFNLDFVRAALSASSYFDHQYPLLSSGILEPETNAHTLINFNGESTDDSGASLFYSAHDGYDYARMASVSYGEPVLAAADGIARFRGDCGACGNMITIDHENGYETRYMHLQGTDLITHIPGNSVRVKSGAMIGRVGSTGNVLPSGPMGAHIHFMVVKDRNNDGNFDDNIPDGVTDPFGWTGKDADPWPAYQFTQGGASKTGTTSNYLWKHAITPTTAMITQQIGGQLQSGGYTVEFPPDSTHENVQVSMLPQMGTVFGAYTSIGNTILIEAKDMFDKAKSLFDKSFTIRVDFEVFPTVDFVPESLALYSSSDDGKTWKKEVTVIDWEHKTAEAQVNHLTQFALMGMRKSTSSEALASPAELRLAYDPNLESFQFEATNGNIASIESEPTVVTDTSGIQETKTIVTATNDAGEKTAAQVLEVFDEQKTSLQIESLMYGKEAAVLAPHELVAEVSRTGPIIHTFTQQMHIRNDWVYAAYNVHDDTTQIVTNNLDQPKVVQGGQSKVALQTDNGAIHYSF